MKCLHPGDISTHAGISRAEYSIMPAAESMNNASSGWTPSGMAQHGKESADERVLVYGCINGVGVSHVSRHPVALQEIERSHDMLLQYIVAFMIIGLIGIIASTIKRK